MDYFEVFPGFAVFLYYNDKCYASSGLEGRSHNQVSVYSILTEAYGPIF
jgi:hypothetical protein